MPLLAQPALIPSKLALVNEALTALKQPPITTLANAKPLVTMLGNSVPVIIKVIRPIHAILETHHSVHEPSALLAIRICKAWHSHGHDASSCFHRRPNLSFESDPIARVR